MVNDWHIDTVVMKASSGTHLDRVGAASVLGDARVLVVRLARSVVVRDVLEDRAKADGVEDCGLLLGVEADALGVAASQRAEGQEPSRERRANDEDDGSRERTSHPQC